MHTQAQTNKRIAILGGTGFVGQSLCNELCKHGYAIRVFTRHREQHRHNLILLPKLELIELDIHDQEQLTHGLKDCDVVINLVGILNEKGHKGEGFHFAHVELAEKLLVACKENNITRLLQMSGLNASAEHGPSFYLKTKGQAEDLLHANKTGINVTSFRPSVIFGRQDSFFNRFNQLLAISPFLPLACHASRFSPIYVLDVCEMMLQSINDPNSYNKRFNLCGPEIFTLKELVEYTAKTSGKSRWIIPLNDFFSKVQAKVFDFVPGKPFSTDNYLSATLDSVCEPNDLEFYTITPTSLRTIVPTYLANKTERSRYNEFRKTH